jgi:hypothetical protein
VSKFRAAQVQHVNATQAVANFLAIYVDGTRHPAESIALQLPALCRRVTLTIAPLRVCLRLRRWIGRGLAWLAAGHCECGYLLHK